MTTLTSTSFDSAKQTFLRTLQGRNRSSATLLAYSTDLGQFIDWLKLELNESWVHQVEMADISAYLGELAERELSGVSRARKLSAIREFFRYLVSHGLLSHSPAESIQSPKREKNIRNYLLSDEYSRMLSLAGGIPRDYAILQVFLQTGIRVSELCDLQVDDIDLQARVLKVRSGKGMVGREIELDKKAARAVASYLKVRGDSLSDQLFLNRYGAPLVERGVRKLVVRYKTRAGITKKIGPHSFRHTFGTLKAQKGVSPFQLKEWLGHANLDTTQIYVHMGKTNGRKAMDATSL